MRYVIVDRKEGVFLGTHIDYSRDVDEEDGVVYVLWAKDNVFSCSKAYSFENKQEARMFADTTLRRWPKAQVRNVDSNEKYVDVVDLLKEGMGQYTFDMVDCIPMMNENIH